MEQPQNTAPATSQASYLSIHSFRVNLLRGGILLWALVVLVSALVPPFGLILAVYLLVEVTQRAIRKRHLLTALFILVLMAAGSFIYYEVFRAYNNAGLTKYNYSGLESYKLAGLESEINLKKPVELSRSNLNKHGETATAQLITPPSPRTPPALMIVSYSIPISDLRYVSALPTIISSGPSNKDFTNFIRPIKDYLKPQVPKGYYLDLKMPQAFNNRNVNSYAWQFDLSIINRDSNNVFGHVRHSFDRQGKLLFIVTNHGVYYLTITDSVYNWLHNQATWQAVLDSVQVK